MFQQNSNSIIIIQKMTAIHTNLSQTLTFDQEMEAKARIDLEAACGAG